MRADAYGSLAAAAREVVAAFDAKPDVDERDHPGGLSHEQVERAWVLWDLRQTRALGRLRDALAPLGPARVRCEPGR